MEWSPIGFVESPFYEGYEGMRYVCSLSLELFPCTSVHFHGENTNRPSVQSFVSR